MVLLGVGVAEVIKEIGVNKEIGKSLEQQEPINTTKTDDQADVVVEVKPITLKGGLEANFEVTLNTHSVELGYDLVKVSTLTDDKGNIYKPVSWSGGYGGHHLSGNLIFPRIPNSVKSVKLIIAGISGIDRIFTWNM